MTRSCWSEGSTGPSLPNVARSVADSSRVRSSSTLRKWPKMVCCSSSLSVESAIATPITGSADKECSPRQSIFFASRSSFLRIPTLRHIAVSPSYSTLSPPRLALLKYTAKRSLGGREN
eukprot:scaffold33843_cov39-Phaeocystis_antarctica.AAC.1